MNIHALLGDNKWEVYEGPIGKIDYDLIKCGEKLQSQMGGMVEICITEYDSNHINVYSFWEGGFSLQRWVKDKLNKAGY